MHKLPNFAIALPLAPAPAPMLSKIYYLWSKPCSVYFPYLRQYIEIFISCMLIMLLSNLAVILVMAVLTGQFYLLDPAILQPLLWKVVAFNGQAAYIAAAVLSSRLVHFFSSDYREYAAGICLCLGLVYAFATSTYLPYKYLFIGELSGVIAFNYFYNRWLA